MRSLDGPPVFTLGPPLIASPHERVKRQVVFEGPYCIPNSLADLPCAELGKEGIVEQMNHVCDKNISMSLGIEQLLESYITRGYDFGSAYASLRRSWLKYVDASSAIWTFQGALRLSTSTATAPGPVYPRKVWDLFSNRVLDYAELLADGSDMVQIDCISHSWRPSDARHPVETPINGHAWPVPIPKATTLDHIRVEMLRYGAEYIWLDVLCLRQHSTERDDLRRHEWEDDIPKIGYIYQAAPRIFTYFNGLGLAFQETDLTSPFHWCNRAWTLQEAYQLLDRMIVVGWSIRSPRMSFKFLEQMKKDGGYRYTVLDTPFKLQLVQKLLNMQKINFALTAVAEMQRRSATKELDKVAGLSNLLGVPSHIREHFYTMRRIV
jgi:hypothetical protein